MMAARTMPVLSQLVSRLPEYPRRAFQVDQMELDSALSQMYALCTNPSLVSKISHARKMTKDHYHRDDPAVLVLQIGFYAVVVVAYGFVFGSGLTAILYTLVYEALLSYLVVGAVMATASWFVANQFLTSPSPTTSVGTRRSADWRYAFDVHCNGYFPYFVWTKVIQFILLPLLWRNTTMGCFLSWTLYTIGIAAYFYNTFLGYLEIPSLTNQQVFTYPAGIAAVLLFLLAVLRGVNLTYWSLNRAWGLDVAYAEELRQSMMSRQ